jgi:hypothetical protein
VIARFTSSVPEAWSYTSNGVTVFATTVMTIAMIASLWFPYAQWRDRVCNLPVFAGL